MEQCFSIFRDYADGPLMTEFHDNFSENDDKQNWFFFASCIEQSIVNFKKLHPEVVSATLWSENGAIIKTHLLLPGYRPYFPKNWGESYGFQ